MADIPYRKKLDLRWSDIDPNMHMRHSVYYDFGAALRTEIMSALGLGMKVFAQEKIGPVLFKEECVFRKEIHFGDTIYIDFELIGASRDSERFAFRHRFTTEDGSICAILTLNGAWMDTVKRKLTPPPPIMVESFHKIPKAEDFQWIETSKSKGE